MFMHFVNTECHYLIESQEVLVFMLETFIQNMLLRGSFKKYIDFCHNFFSRRHITLRFGTHIWTTNSVDLHLKISNLTRYIKK